MIFKEAFLQVYPADLVDKGAGKQHGSGGVATLLRAESYDNTGLRSHIACKKFGVKDFL